MSLEDSLVTKLDGELSNILGKKPSKNKHILVLSGGGVKGISLLGALQVLEDLDLLKYIEIYSGSSIGAVTCALIVIGYTPAELYEFVMLFDVTKMVSIKPSNMLCSFGLDDGSNSIKVLNKMFESKKIDPNITFLELYRKTGKKLIVCTSCVNDKKTHYLSHETYPDLQVILGLRM